MIAIFTSCKHQLDSKGIKETEGSIRNQLFKLREIDEGSIDKIENIDLISISSSPKRSYEDIKKQYPDKKILTVYNICPVDLVTDRLNEYLTESGTDYVVYFQILDNSNINSFMKEEWKIIEQDTEGLIDIFYIRNNYALTKLVKDNKLEPFDEFLNTTKGQELYQAMPETNWKILTRNNKIYGISGFATFVFGPPSYIVNKKLMDQYNLTESDLKKPLHELEEIIHKVAEGEKNRTNFVPLVINKLYLYQSGGKTLIPSSDSVILSDNVSDQALLQIDDPEYIQWLKTLYRYAKLGYAQYCDIPEQIDQFFLHPYPRSLLPQSSPHFGYFHNEKGEFADQEDILEIILEQEGKGSAIPHTFGNVIPVSSKQKDSAFDFLYRVYTEPYLTNLLLCGIENKTYTLENGKITKQIYYINDDCIGNSYLSYPLFYEHLDKMERYTKIHNSIVSEYYDLTLDFSKVSNEITKTNLVMSQIAGLFDEGVEDFDSYLHNIREQLFEAGVQKVLDEINSQKKEWMREGSDERQGY